MASSDLDIFYRYLQKKLIEQEEVFRDLMLAEVKGYFSNAYHIPRNLTIPIIKEMEKKGFLRIEGKTNNAKIILMNRHLSKLIDNTSKLYRVAGCF